MKKKNIKTRHFEIIVTGATGFVGRNLIRKIVGVYPANRILCLIYCKNNPQEISGREVIRDFKVATKLVDLVTGEGLTDLPKDPRLIIHLAAQTDTSIRDHSVNDIGAKNLYKAFGKLDKQTHFIHVGTMVEVVGRPNCQDGINENSKDYPTNEYTRTKLVGEKFIIQKCQKDKFRLTVIRPNTIYGKGVRKGSLFDMVVNMIKKGSIITKVNWPGRSALIHVDDVADLIIRFSKENPLPGKPQQYLAYSENLTVADISMLIHHKLKLKYNPVPIPAIFWTLIKKGRILIPFFEKVLPYSLYNYLWRFGIIIDDAVWCKSQKLFRKYPSFKPKKLIDCVSDVT